MKSGKPPVFSGEVALVTGAASGIGKACVESLLARGAAVIGLDINPAIASLFKRADFLGIRCASPAIAKFNPRWSKPCAASAGSTC